MGDDGQGEAMVRARFRVNEAGVCLQPPRGGLVTVWDVGQGEMAGRIRSRGLPRTGLARVCWDLRLSAGWAGCSRVVRLGVESLAAGSGRD